MRTLAIVLALVLVPGAVSPAQAKAKKTHPPASVAGKFDYYVLSLSWSPVYCEHHAEDKEQCGATKFGFVLHGLWPQYTNGGFPCVPW